MRCFRALTGALAQCRPTPAFVRHERNLVMLLTEVFGFSAALTPSAQSVHSEPLIHLTFVQSLANTVYKSVFKRTGA